MNYLIRTEEIEYHIIRAEKPENVMEILANHFRQLWGKEDCDKLMATAEIVGKWDETPGYKATFYGTDEEDKIILIYPKFSESIIE